MVRLLAVCKDNRNSTSVDFFPSGKLYDFKLNNVSYLTCNYTAKKNKNGCTLIHIPFFFVEILMSLTLLVYTTKMLHVCRLFSWILV